MDRGMGGSDAKTQLRGHTRTPPANRCLKKRNEGAGLTPHVSRALGIRIRRQQAAAHSGRDQQQDPAPLIPHLLSLPRSPQSPDDWSPEAMSSLEDEDSGPPLSKRSRRGLVQDQEQEDEEEEDAQFEVQDLWKVKLFSGSCETCKATFTDPAYLLVHRPCYFGTSAFAPSPATAPDGKQYGCKFCVKRFPSLEQIRQHIRFHLEKRYYCKFCEYRGSSQYDVKYHSESVHARQIPDYLRNKNKHKGYKSVGRGRRPTPSASYGQSYARSPGHSSDSRALVPAVGSSSSGYSSAAAASLSLMLADRGLENESSEWGFSNMKLDDIHGLEDFYTIRPFSQVCYSNCE